MILSYILKFPIYYTLKVIVIMNHSYNKKQVDVIVHKDRKWFQILKQASIQKKKQKKKSSIKKKTKLKTGCHMNMI